MILDRQYETTIERQRERQRVIDIYGERETDRERETEREREREREWERDREKERGDSSDQLYLNEYSEIEKRIEQGIF